MKCEGVLPAGENRGAAGRHFVVFLLVALFVVVSLTVVKAAPKADLWSKWLARDDQSRTRVDHRSWDRLLKSYVATDDPSGINRVRYAHVTPEDRKALDEYLKGLQSVQVSGLNPDEQKAFWINLYNALTVKLILDHYPVRTIRDIDISPGWFEDGPWGAKLVRVEGEDVALDDIEHRILRPVWQDNRIHYAVNCASLGCPNLQPEAFTREKTETLLERAAREYANHPRGVRIEGSQLILSAIYKWFQADFGGAQEKVIEHLLKYVEGPKAGILRGFRGKIQYEYNWQLNE